MKTENNQTNTPKKRQYRRIPLKKKIELIKRVFRRRKPLEDAIRDLGFKKTTAVNIINRFKQTGELPFRKFKKPKPYSKKKRVLIKEEEQVNKSAKLKNQVKTEEEEIEYIRWNDQVEEDDVPKQEPESPQPQYLFY